MDRSEFAEGLSRIGIATGKPVVAAVLGVYYDALAGQCTGEEWRRFACAAVASGRFRWFPVVAELLDALREWRGMPALDSEAARAYERVLAAGSYSAEGGTSWSYRRVEELCGAAAAEAFLASGGHSAWATTFDEAKRRERFTRAYVEAAREDPSSRLLPAGREPRLLPTSVEAEDDGPPSPRVVAQTLAHIKALMESSK